MNSSLQTKLLAVTLAAVAVVAAIFLLKPSEPEKEKPVPTAKTHPRKTHPKMAPRTDPASSGHKGTAIPDSSGPVTAEGLAEIDTFIKSYAKAADSDEKIDLLADVRKLELEDQPAINNLLLEEIFDPDEEVRDSARTALVEYGGKNAHQALAELLQARPDAPEITELKKVLDILILPPYSPAEKRSAPETGSPSSQPRQQQQPNQ